MSDTPPSPPSPPSRGQPSDPDKLRQRERAFQWLKRIGRARIPVQSAAPTRENWFPMQHSDWLKLRQKVANLKEPLPYLASVGWTCVGITTGALLGLLAWLPVYSALPVKAHMRYTFITPLLIITATAGTVIVAFTFAVGHQVKQVHVTTVENVLADMDSIYEPYSHTD